MKLSFFLKKGRGEDTYLDVCKNLETLMTQ